MYIDYYILSLKNILRNYIKKMRREERIRISDALLILKDPLKPRNMIRSRILIEYNLIRLARKCLMQQKKLNNTQFYNNVHWNNSGEKNLNIIRLEH